MRVIARICITFLTVVPGLLFPVVATADPYDDCVLEHIGAATIRDAALAIERACINKTSVEIDDKNQLVSRLLSNDKVSLVTGKNYGLLITTENDGDYAITELKIRIIEMKTSKSHDYIVGEFMEPPGRPLVELPEPEFSQIIKRGQTRSFFVPITEQAATTEEFAQRYAWVIIWTKGIPSLKSVK
jgi:hypothetical protein